MRKANIQPGQNVLVYGASGSVGVYAVQLAKHWGARVTAVCSTANVEMVKWLGADQVVDYTTQDFSAAGRVFDLAFDTVGKAKPSRVLKVLKRGSPYVMIAPSEPAWAIPFHMVQQMWISLTGAAKIIGGVTKLTPGDHAFFKRLIEAGELKTVIDRRYSLANIADAFRYAEAGHKKGHVLILAE
jgi:NADPH:quinone reductase-like Zn-dependent oxidoreductase